MARVLTQLTSSLQLDSLTCPSAVRTCILCPAFCFRFVHGGLLAETPHILVNPASPFPLTSPLLLEFLSDLSRSGQALSQFPGLAAHTSVSVLTPPQALAKFLASQSVLALWVVKAQATLLVQSSVDKRGGGNCPVLNVYYFCLLILT